ncbi:MAG: DinB family protein [Acidobacteriota bacterium]
MTSTVDAHATQHASSPTVPPNQVPLPSPLDDLHQQLQVIRSDAEKLLDGLDNETLNWSIDEESWSIGQCLEHLAVVDWSYGKAIERRLEREIARGKVGEPVSREARYSALERMWIRSIEPPATRSFPAPPSMKPPSTLDLDALQERFFGANARLTQAVESARGIDVTRVKIGLPIFPLVRLRIGAALSVVTSHDRRHLWQAWKVRRHADFPTPR